MPKIITIEDKIIPKADTIWKYIKLFSTAIILNVSIMKLLPDREVSPSPPNTSIKKKIWESNKYKIANGCTQGKNKKKDEEEQRRLGGTRTENCRGKEQAVTGIELYETCMNYLFANWDFFPALLSSFCVSKKSLLLAW